MEYKLTFTDWREGARAGKLLGLKCPGCGTVTCPPRKVCSGCGSENLDIIELSKKGEIISFTVCYAVPTGFEGPYVVAIADLEDGGRVMGDVLDIDPAKAGMDLMGKKVQIGFKEIPGDFMTGQDTRLALTLKILV
jgi:uncharacterized protein